MKTHTLLSFTQVYIPGMADDRISLSEEIVQKTRMRGTLTWAPPRFQIIFCVQPTHRSVRPLFPH